MSRRKKSTGDNSGEKVQLLQAPEELPLLIPGGKQKINNRSSLMHRTVNVTIVNEEYMKRERERKERRKQEEGPQEQPEALQEGGPRSWLRKEPRVTLNVSGCRPPLNLTRGGGKGGGSPT